MFETITPIDNSVLLKREYAIEEDIEASLSNSYSVREHWKNISLEERKKSVLNFVEIFLKNKDVSSNLCKQIGRPIAQCPGEMRGFEERARYMIENAERALSRVVSIKNDEFDKPHGLPTPTTQVVSKRLSVTQEHHSYKQQLQDEPWKRHKFFKVID